MTLPTDSNDRKNYAVHRGCLRYFPAALAGVSKISKLGNDKHNPGQDMHHARNKSQDHGDCILRHLIDVDDLLIALDRGETVDKEAILNEISSMAWRALALSQEIHEKLGAPLAPGARVDKKEEPKKISSPAVDLFKAAEEAHANIVRTQEINRKLREIGVAPVLVKREVKFQVGDVVKHINNDVEVTVEGTYFDVNDNPVLFVKDSEGKVFGVDPNFYKSIYAEKSS